MYDYLQYWLHFDYFSKFWMCFISCLDSTVLSFEQGSKHTSGVSWCPPNSLRFGQWPLHPFLSTVLNIFVVLQLQRWNMRLQLILLLLQQSCNAPDCAPEGDNSTGALLRWVVGGAATPNLTGESIRSTWWASHFSLRGGGHRKGKCRCQNSARENRDKTMQSWCLRA